MFEVTVRGRFEAAHQLRLGQQAIEPLHEHHWRVAVTFAGPQLDPAGMLLDFEQAHQRLDALLASLNDHNLNALPSFADQSPSAEVVARYVAEHFDLTLPEGVRLASVEVEEKPGCVARYLPNT